MTSTPLNHRNRHSPNRPVAPDRSHGENRTESGKSAPNPHLSQRDSITQPKVDRSGLPWVPHPQTPSTLKGLHPFDNSLSHPNVKVLALNSWSANPEQRVRGSFSHQRVRAFQKQIQRFDLCGIICALAQHECRVVPQGGPWWSIGQKLYKRGKAWAPEAIQDIRCACCGFNLLPIIG